MIQTREKWGVWYDICSHVSDANVPTYMFQAFERNVLVKEIGNNEDMRGGFRTSE